MATKGGGGGVENVGAIGVEVILEGESLAQQVQEQMQGVEGSQTTGSTRARDIAKPARDASPSVTNVDAKVKTKIEGSIAKDVQGAIDAQEYEITLNTESIRRQVELALSRAFDITLNVRNAEGATAEHLASVGASPGASVVAGAAVSRGAPPQEVTKTLTKHAKDAIDSVYDNLNRVMQESGKGAFGRLSTAPGNQAEKALELMGAFGSKMSEILDIDFEGDVVPTVRGGSMTPEALSKNLGIDPNAPSMPSLDTALRGFFNESGSSRSTDIFFNRLQKWATETPEIVQPTAGPEQVIQHAVSTVKKEGGAMRVATEPVATPATDELAGALKTLRAEREKIPFEALDTARIQERFPVNRAPARGRPSPRGPDLDPEATRIANQQLGNDRANVRRLIPGAPVQTINGIKVDLEPFLTALRQGEFAGAFRTKEGELKRFTPQTPEQELQAAELAKSRRGFKLEGVGMVQPVGPTEAFRTAITEAFDEDVASQIFSNPELKNIISQSARQGSAAKPFVSPQAPVAGQGSGESQIISSSGKGFESGYRAALQLLEVQEQIKEVTADIDGIWEKIETRAGSGKPTDTLEATARRREDRLAQLKARETDLTERALPLTGTTPAQARALAESQRLSGAENRSRVARGEGLTSEELAKSALRNPVLLGQRGREMIDRGALPDPEQIMKDVIERAAERNVGGEPISRATGNAVREVFDELKEMLPEKGPERTEGEFQLSAVRKALFGESERVVAAEGAVSSLAKERRGGLIPTMEKEVQQEADRAESGRGGGRRAKELGVERTGASAASGVAETRPVVSRPTTSLDIERQQLASEYEALAGAFAFEENQRQARNVKRRKGAGRFSEAQPVEDILRSPPVRGPGGRTVAAGFTQPVREKVETLTDAGARTREIRETQAEADRLLKDIAAGTEPAIGPRENFSSLMEEQRARVERFAPNEAVKKEALEVLETRTASMARHPDTAAGKDPLTGNALGEKARETRSRFINDPGDVAPGEGVFAAYNRRGGGNGNRPPAPPGAPGGGGQRPEVSGVIHVIVDNVPLAVTMSGASGAGAGAGTGAGPQQAAVDARQKFTINRAELRRAMTEQNQRFVEDFITKQRDAGKSDTAIKGALNKAGFGIGAALALDAGEEGRGPGVGSAGGLNQFRSNLGLSRTGLEETFGQVQESDVFRSELNAQLRSLERQIPKRGFTASVTDLFTNIGGFLDSSVEAIDVLRREGGQLAGLRAKQATLTSQRGVLAETIGAGESRLADIGARRDAARASGNRNETRTLAREFQGVERDLNKFRKTLQNVNVALEDNTEALGLQEKVVEGAQAALPSAATRGAGFLVGGVAAAGAVAVGTIVAQAGQQMLQVVTEALGPVVERLSGFAGTVGRIQDDLAGNIRDQGDKTEEVLAAMGSAARLTDQQLAAVSGPLGERGETVSRGRAVGEQFDLFNVAQSIERQRLPGGFDRGLSRPTGGLFDAQLPFKLFGVQNISVGGEPSVSERLVNQLSALPNAGDRGNARRSIEQETGNLTGEPVPQPLGEALSPEDEGAKRVTVSTEKLDEFNEGLDFLNENLKKSGFRLVEDSTEAGKAMLDAQHRLFELAGEGDLGGKLREQQIRVEGIDPQGNQQQILKFLEAFSKGPALSVKQLLDQQKSQLRAQIQTQEVQRRFQLDTIIPQTTALAGVQRPFTDASAGIEFSSADSSSARKQINADLKITQGLYNDINKEIDLGVSMAKDFVANGADVFGIGIKVGGLGKEAGDQFAASLDNVRRIGRDIASIEIGLQTKQAAYQAAQFSYQIGIAKRSLADAKGLAGQITDAGKENLGVLERQQFFLQRRAQALQMEQQQRQINFSRAIAGFTAPGLTGEERAARIQQAKIEADFAQKQLNIQKELFGLQGRGFQITASRQVQDLTQQLGLLEKGRVITLETAAAEKRIRALTAIQERENKKVEALYAAAVDRTNDIVKLTGELASAVGKDMGEVANDVIDAYSKVLRSIINQASGAFTGHGGAAGYGQYDSKNATNRAAGGNVMRGVTYEVNEQGEEFFTPGENGVVTPLSAIQQVTPIAGASMGSQPAPITILITGNKFNSEEELRQLEARITEAVNRAQSRHLSLLGGRSY